MKKTAPIKTKAATLCAALFCLLFPACQKSGETHDPQQLKSAAITETPNLIGIKDSALWFPNMRIADSMGTVLNQMPREQFEQWEKQMGYLSQRTIYRNCVDEMNSAQTPEQLRETIKKYGDILKMENNMVMPNFWLPHASISNREGIHYAGDWLIKCADTCLLKVKHGTKQNIALYAGAKESYFTENVIYVKRKAFKETNLAENNASSKLKTGLYCGYGWYGGLIEHLCYNPDEKYEIRFGMWFFCDIIEEFYCNFAYKYKLGVYADTYKKKFFGWVAYDTDIEFKNMKFKAIYPVELDDYEPCETCPGYPAACADWTCVTGEFNVPGFVVENTCYGFLDPPLLLGTSVLNPLSPPSINGDPKFQQVHGEATFPDMDGVHAVINYGYSGTQGGYCEQR